MDFQDQFLAINVVYILPKSMISSFWERGRYLSVIDNGGQYVRVVLHA